MQHIPLPPARIRRGEARRHHDDQHFIDTALKDADILYSVGLQAGQRLVDFGCGPGRLAIGLISSGWSGSYLGFEVKEHHVLWASAQLTSRHPDYRFMRVDSPNARYNPAGLAQQELPIEDGSIDFVCAFSVFTHMLGTETETWLTEFRRVLKPQGLAFITAFIEDDVPDETENPPWYGRGDWSGRLHCVLYSTERIHTLVADAELAVQRRITTEGREQTGLLLSAS